MALFSEDDPDQQMPMPFQAADDYACVVMRWARELPAAGINIERGAVYGNDRLHRYDVFSPTGASNAPVVVFWHGGLEERVYALVLENASLDAVMSPICWTAGNGVPFALTAGENDSERVRRSNARMLELLKLQHANADLRVMPGQDHFQTHTSLRDAGHPWYRRLVAMFQGT